MNSWVDALAVMPGGDLIAAGNFTLAGGVACSRIARWDGVVWSPLGTGMDAWVEALTVTATGQLVAGGMFATAGGVVCNGVARWNGATWSALGGGVAGGRVEVLASLPDTSLVAGGTFTMAGGAPIAHLARWDGNSWSAPGGGVDGPVEALHVPLSGDVIAGGTFAQAGASPASRLAVWHPTCAASVAAYGIGCSGSGGLKTLSVVMPAWEGGSFISRATGLPMFGVAVSVFGFGQLSIPLPSLFAEAATGCTLLATPDRLDFVLPAGGTALTAIAITPTPSLLGTILRHQVVVFELDLQAQVVEITSTNGIEFGVGTY
jgi:hypothetical protein